MTNRDPIRDDAPWHRHAIHAIALLIASLALVGSAVAAPSVDQPFEVRSWREDSPIDGGRLSASRSDIFIHLEKHDAICNVLGKAKAPTGAFFYIKGQVLYLHTSNGPVQRVFVDRSGSGQGKLGYLSGNGPFPPRFETKGWKVDKSDNLDFSGKGLIACPILGKESWTVWVDTGSSNPGGNQGCLAFIPHTFPSDKPIRCEYTQ